MSRRLVGGLERVIMREGDLLSTGLVLESRIEEKGIEIVTETETEIGIGIGIGSGSSSLEL